MAHPRKPMWADRLSPLRNRTPRARSHRWREALCCRAGCGSPWVSTCSWVHVLGLSLPDPAPKALFSANPPFSAHSEPSADCLCPSDRLLLGWENSPQHRGFQMEEAATDNQGHRTLLSCALPALKCDLPCQLPHVPPRSWSGRVAAAHPSPGPGPTSRGWPHAAVGLCMAGQGPWPPALSVVQARAPATAQAAAEPARPWGWGLDPDTLVLRGAC